MNELLKNAGDINEQDADGNTALHLAAGSIECLKALLKAGATIDIKNEDGNTALHRAAGYNESKCVKELLLHHANPNAQNQYGNAPLHEALEMTYFYYNDSPSNLAMRREHVLCIEILLANKSNPHLLNNIGNTARMMASDSKVIALMNNCPRYI